MSVLVLAHVDIAQWWTQQANDSICRLSKSLRQGVATLCCRDVGTCVWWRPEAWNFWPSRAISRCVVSWENVIYRELVPNVYICEFAAVLLLGERPQLRPYGLYTDRQSRVVHHRTSREHQLERGCQLWKTHAEVDLLSGTTTNTTRVVWQGPDCRCTERRGWGAFINLFMPSKISVVAVIASKVMFQVTNTVRVFIAFYTSGTG